MNRGWFVKVKPKTINGQDGWVVSYSDLYSSTQIPVQESFGFPAMGPRLALESLCLKKGWGIIAFEDRPKGEEMEAYVSELDAP